jgi:hypothetical protein
MALWSVRRWGGVLSGRSRDLLRGGIRKTKFISDLRIHEVCNDELFFFFASFLSCD